MRGHVLSMSQRALTGPCYTTCVDVTNRIRALLFLRLKFVSISVTWIFISCGVYILFMDIEQFCLVGTYNYYN